MSLPFIFGTVSPAGWNTA